MIRFPSQLELDSDPPHYLALEVSSFSFIIWFRWKETFFQTFFLESFVTSNHFFTMTNDNEEKLPTISDDLVVTKYKMAAEIVNRKFS